MNPFGVESHPVSKAFGGRLLTSKAPGEFKMVWNTKAAAKKRIGVVNAAKAERSQERQARIGGVAGRFVRRHSTAELGVTGIGAGYLYGRRHQ